MKLTTSSFINWFIRIMGVSCLFLLITGKSMDNGWVSVDIFMIAIWLWNEYSIYTKMKS